MIASGTKSSRSLAIVCSEKYSQQNAIHKNEVGIETALLTILLQSSSLNQLLNQMRPPNAIKKSTTIYHSAPSRCMRCQISANFFTKAKFAEISRMRFGKVINLGNEISRKFHATKFTQISRAFFLVWGWLLGSLGLLLGFEKAKRDIRKLLTSTLYY